MRGIAGKAIGLRAIVAAISMASAPAMALSDTYFLGIGSCPPWIEPAGSGAEADGAAFCASDVALMSGVVSERFGVAPENSVSLIQEEATPMRFFKEIKRLEDVLAKTDTLIVYQISHGGIGVYDYQGYPTRGEVFAYYTEARPEDSQAVAAGQWLSARDMRDSIYGLGAATGADILLVIEACHAAAITDQLIHNPFLDLAGDSRIAFLLSAGPGETSNFNAQRTGGRFTEDFSAALATAPAGSSLADIFAQTRETTHRAALAACNALDEKVTNTLLRAPDQYFYLCTQEPEYVDPRGLLLDLAVN